VIKLTVPMHKPSRRPEGFTLIELTVVILVIAILMGFIFTAGQATVDRSRKVQAKNDLTQIVTANRVGLQGALNHQSPISREYPLCGIWKIPCARFSTEYAERLLDWRLEQS
jgi:prepilin-type N-terminal cleavage/methylation domain-containing protein